MPRSTPPPWEGAGGEVNIKTMNIFKSYKRTRFFLWINIIGLSIGLAISIMLVLYIVDQFSFDKHFKNKDRIVKLLTKSESEGNKKPAYFSACLITAGTVLPDKVPGIEATAQICNNGSLEMTANDKRYGSLKTYMVNTEFFEVFSMTFLAGSPSSALASPSSMVITRRQAEIIFGGVEQAMNQPAIVSGTDYTVTAVVEELPMNTHFSFDLLANISSVPWLAGTIGIDFHTYYLIKEDASLEATRKAIEDEYTVLLKPWTGDSAIKASGVTEMLGDVYLKTKATYVLDKKSDVTLISVLSGLAILILILAITNFINLYISQGETRMNEIAIRKTNGGQIKDIVRQFFTEVSLIVLIAFVIGFILSALCIEYVLPLIDLRQLLSPLFIVSILALFIITVVCSAFYPAIYLSKFTPLEILGKRIKLSKRQLTAGIVIFQSILSIILLSFIVTIYKQTAYLKDLPLGYNPNQLVSVVDSQITYQRYDAIKEELLKLPIVQSVGVSHHIVGDGCSRQRIMPWGNKDGELSINEYRMMTGMPDMMGFELVEGRYWNESDPDSICLILLNEAAVKALGDETPLETVYEYRGETRVTGVVKDFIYGNPVDKIAPLMIARTPDPSVYNIRFNEGVTRLQAEEAILSVFRRFAPDYIMNPRWSIDLYNAKFSELKQYTRILITATAISIFIAMLGLLAIHLYSSIRRTKEIAIRRIHGAEKGSVFRLLSLDILKWIGIAAVIASPIAWYLIKEVLSNYANHISIDWTIFAWPIVVQCIIALLTTSGITLWVLSRNPAKSINN